MKKHNSVSDGPREQITLPNGELPRPELSNTVPFTQPAPVQHKGLKGYNIPEGMSTELFMARMAKQAKEN